MSPGRSLWELLAYGLGVFPGGERRVQLGPLDEQLGYRTILPGVQPPLEDFFWHLEVVVHVWQRR